MEIIEVMRKVDDFIELKLLPQIANYKNKEIIVSFKEILRFDSGLAEQFLDDFYNVNVQFYNSLSERLNDPAVEVRYSDLPKETKIPLWKIRHKHVGKLIQIEGYVRKIGGVNHITSWKKFECINCGATKSLKQIPKPQKPYKCGGIECGCKIFRVIEQKQHDVQKIIIEEDREEIGSEQTPERKLVTLTRGLTNPELTKKIQPSGKLRVIGIVNEEQKNPEKPEFYTYVEANNIEFINEEKIILSKEDLIEIDKVAKTDTVMEDMARSISPTTHGMEDIRKAIFLQLIGAEHVYEKNMLVERGTINILLAGSPGCNKTVLIRKATQFVPRARYVGSSTASGVGLVASVKKDEELGDYSVEPGAIPLANGALLSLDETDKVKKEDIGYMNIAIDKLEVPIDKANIHTILKTNTSILAAANPKHRVFDERDTYISQVDLPKDFMDRFDLIFCIPSIKVESDQRLIADMIFSKYGNGLQSNLNKIYDTEFVKKFVFRAKQIKPTLSKEAMETLKEEFIRIVKPGSEDEGAYFSSRMLMNLIRLSLASAKAHLREIVTKEDALISVELMQAALKSCGLIKDNVLNVIGYEQVTDKNKRDQYHTIIAIIRDLSVGGDAKFMDIVTKAKDFNITEDKVDELLIKMSTQGEIFSPRRGEFKLA